LLVAQLLLQQAVVAGLVEILLANLEVLVEVVQAVMRRLEGREHLDRGTMELPELLEMAVFIMLAAEAEALVL